MLMQVVLVELSHREGITREIYAFIYFMILISDVNSYEMF